MEPQPNNHTLPPGIWDDPQPDEMDPYRSFVQAYAAEDEDLVGQSAHGEYGYGCESSILHGHTDCSGIENKTGTLVTQRIVEDVPHDPVNSGTVIDNIDIGWQQTTIELGFCRDVYLRFPNLGIPAGSTINDARLYFTPLADGADTAHVAIRGEDSADPQPITDESLPSSRDLTTHGMSWLLPFGDWQVADGTDAVESPSIGCILQELLDDYPDADWLQLFLFNYGDEHLEASDGLRAAYAPIDDTDKAPLLRVWYTPPATIPSRAAFWLQMCDAV
jgi:hypothetical protein